MALGGAGVPRVLLWVALGYMIASIAAAPVVEQAVRKNATTRTPAEIARAWSTEKIVGLAIKEGAGLLGITVALLMGSGTWAVLFGAAAVGSMFLAAPEKADLTARAYTGQGEGSSTPGSD
jgi:F0F1-type ATP synthase membrane subunit c/vacuolar-type H+-ATPase subunit K